MAVKFHLKPSYFSCTMTNSRILTKILYLGSREYKISRHFKPTRKPSLEMTIHNSYVWRILPDIHSRKHEIRHHQCKIRNKNKAHESLYLPHALALAVLQGDGNIAQKL